MKVPPSSPYLNPPLRQGAVRSREDVDPRVREAAEGLEAIFLETMMKAMRETVQSSELSMENAATKIYRGMLDSEVAQSAARNNSVGLADQVIAYLEQQSYTGNRAVPHGRARPEAESAESAKEVSTGGTDESESIR